jgi:hypothetical protein
MKVADSCNQNIPFPIMLESGEFTVFNFMENSAVILFSCIKSTADHLQIWAEGTDHLKTTSINVKISAEMLPCLVTLHFHIILFMYTYIYNEQ